MLREFTLTQTISELDELHENLKGSDLEHIQLTPGQFHTQTTRIDLGASFLDVGEYDRVLRARGSIGSEYKTFFFIPRQERQKLRRARPGQTTVSDVAVACGFWHLGRFSGAYKALFGESPSDTLKRCTG